mgnify:FL=1
MDKIDNIFGKDDTMPWDTNDSPHSWKNLKQEVRKKAIDIANAMIDEGYDEGTAIPIATKQAKEWYEDASKKEKQAIKKKSDKDLRERSDKSNKSRPELQDKEQHVIKRVDGWAVKAKDGKKASHIFKTKKEALQRARKIANNKGTTVKVID